VVLHHLKWHRGSPISEWHGDICSHPQTNSGILTVSVYLDDVTPEHGSLQVVPGTHVLRPVERLVLGSAISVRERIMPHVALEAAAGGVCIHRAYLVHKPAPLDKHRSRNVIVISYRASDAQMLVPNTFGEGASGELVTGCEPMTWHVESAAAVYASECVTAAGELLRNSRTTELRLRCHRPGMM
jgi:hypothetical protein